VEPDPNHVQRVARATCAQLHEQALATGYLVRPRSDPGSYRSQQVWPVVYAALATGLLEVRDE
jgi:hypothetical protein